MDAHKREPHPLRKAKSRKRLRDIEEGVLQAEDYAHDPLLFYPGRNLSDTEKQRMDSYEIKIGELTIDHIIYSMSRQIEVNFQTFYTIAEEIIGADKALQIAREIGRRYGGQGYAKFLKALGRGNDGSPQTMVQYQDLVHAIRGPKHTAALFAEHDETRCVVKRKACIYFSEAHPNNAKYTAEFERGCFDGYMAADKNLKRIEVVKCLCRGADTCEQHWIYKD